jgi:hypothetical protein
MKVGFGGRAGSALFYAETGVIRSKTISRSADRPYLFITRIGLPPNHAAMSSTTPL